MCWCTFKWNTPANTILHMSKRNRERTSNVSPIVACVVFIWILLLSALLSQLSPRETELSNSNLAMSVSSFDATIIYFMTWQWVLFFEALSLDPPFKDLLLSSCFWSSVGFDNSCTMPVRNVFTHPLPCHVHSCCWCHDWFDDLVMFFDLWSSSIRPAFKRCFLLKFVFDFKMCDVPPPFLNDVVSSKKCDPCSLPDGTPKRRCKHVVTEQTQPRQWGLPCDSSQWQPNWGLEHPVQVVAFCQQWGHSLPFHVQCWLRPWLNPNCLCHLRDVRFRPWFNLIHDGKIYVPDPSSSESRLTSCTKSPSAIFLWSCALSTVLCSIPLSSSGANNRQRWQFSGFG